MRRAPHCGLAAALIALLALTAPAVTAQTELPPPTFSHIVVIVLDDVGVDNLSCYGEGSDTPSTPNICDRLASKGALFRNAWANPTCSPTRASIQTGRYGFRTGVTFAGDELPPGEITLPEALAEPLDQQLGFATAAIGKWHLSGANRSHPPNCPMPGNPLDHGYDHAAGAITNIGDYFDWCRTVDGVTGVCTAGGSVPACAVQPYATIVNVDDALAWIGQQNGPWFLWLAFNAPHSPFHVPPDQCPSGPCYSVTLPPELEEGDACSGGEERPCYKAMLETLDTEVGRLLDNLPADTAILLLGDNGTPEEVTVPPFDPDHAKFTVYEGGVNVPMILVAEGLATPDAEVRALVNTSDLFTTLLDLAGAEVPPGIEHDSVSLVDVLRKSEKGRRFTFAETHRAGVEEHRKAVRGPRYKTIRAPNVPDDDKIELYDLIADPFETTDLYDDLDPDLSEQEQEAFDDLQTFLDHLDGPIPTCPPTP